MFSCINVFVAYATGNLKQILFNNYDSDSDDEDTNVNNITSEQIQHTKKQCKIGGVDGAVAMLEELERVTKRKEDRLAKKRLDEEQSKSATGSNLVPVGQKTTLRKAEITKRGEDRNQEMRVSKRNEKERNQTGSQGEGNEKSKVNDGK